MAKFKVGDRVRLLRVNGSERWGKLGEEGTVLIEDDGCDDCRVRFDSSGDWYASWSDLEHVTAAVAPATAAPVLTIEAGKFYKTRDGRKVKIVRVDDTDTQFPYCHDSGDGAHHWLRADGTSCINDAEADIVAEWFDEPATTKPLNVTLGIDLNPPAPPQVGDDVLIFGTIAGITHSPRGTNYNIVFETQNRRVSLHFLEEDFIVAPSDDGDCPCANNDNGPLPFGGDTAKAFDGLATWLQSLAVNRAA